MTVKIMLITYGSFVNDITTQMKKATTSEKPVSKYIVRNLTCFTEYCFHQMHLCERCDRSYAPSAYNRHIATVHGPKRFLCDKCGKMYTDNSSLTYHYRIVHNVSKIRFYQLCTQIFKISWILSIITDTSLCITGILDGLTLFQQIKRDHVRLLHFNSWDETSQEFNWTNLIANHRAFYLI